MKAVTISKERNEKGRFIAGNSGKPKGAKNKCSIHLKESITAFLNDKLEDLESIWQSLDDKDKAVLFISLSKMVLPKESEPIEPPTEQNVLTPEIQTILDKLK